MSSHVPYRLSPLLSVLFAAAFSLSGCADPASLAFSGANAVSVANSGKTLADHAMSIATDQDCSLQNSLAGKAWCQPRRFAAIPSHTNQTVLHCYRSIAEITCYRHENPHETATQQTGKARLSAN